MVIIDLINQVFTNLTVISRNGSQNGHALWNCICVCGNRVVATTGDLRQGKTKSCGCLRAQRSKLSVIDETNNIYGRLTVIERSGSGKDKNALWKCKCECGNEAIVSGKDLRSGHTKSCGCYNKDITSNNSLIDISGQRFGMLTVVCREGTYRSNKGSRSMSSVWKCLCDCGNYTLVSRTGLSHTKSCGCLRESSINERFIAELLKTNNINHIREYSFDDLVGPGNGYLRFDFAIFDKNNSLLCLIEYQGEQHSEAFAKSNFGKLQREITDKLKKQYCSKNGIDICYINYDDDIVSKLNEILNYYSLYVNSVPSLNL